MNLREKMILNIVQGLEKESSKEKIQTLKFISEYGHELKIIIDKVIPLLNDTDERVRLKTADILKEAKHDLSSVIDDILAAYQKEDKIEIKASLIELMGVSGSKKILNFLIKSYNENENDFLRQVIIEALSVLGFTETLPIILKALKDPAANVRYVAADSLRWIKSDEKIEPLIKALKDDDSIVRSSAAWALGTCSKNDMIVNALIHALQKDEDEYVRYNIMKTMGELRDDKFVPVLFDNIKNDEEIKNKIRAIEILGEIGSKKAINGLIDLYKNTNSFTLKNKINFAMRFADKDSLEVFKKIQTTESKKREDVKHQKEVDALINYRINELHKILLNYNSMSIGLLAGLLKIEDEAKIIDWLKNLPENLGIKMIENVDYDTISLNLHKDETTMLDKINKIIKYFETKFREYES
jgi:HEAT repeat protein